MRFFSRPLSAVLLSLSLAVMARAENQVIPLWPEGVPGLHEGGAPEEISADQSHSSKVNVPTLVAFLAPADKAVGTAVIIAPGGSYTSLSLSNEGAKVAEWLNSLGVSAFVLHYRLKEYGHPAPLRDALRAIRLVRSRAAEFGVKPERVGFAGFSAGGHLASTAVTLFDAPEGKTGAELDKVSARPDFGILIYPVITMKPPLAHAGSRANLIGKEPAAELVEAMSTESRVTKDTPPCFLVATGDDRTVPVENSILFYQALKNAKVSAELHLYEKGGHGFGMKPGLGQVSDWPKRAEEFMQARGWLTKG